MPDGHCRWPSSRELMGGGESLHHEIPISRFAFPRKRALEKSGNRLGGSGHIKTGHLAPKSRVMRTTPKVLARDTITSEMLSIFLLPASEASDSVWIS